MASSRRPRRVQGVPTEFSLRSAEFYVAFHRACTTFSPRLGGALGVRTALPRRSHSAYTAFAPRLTRRSSTALTACRQNRNKVSLICTFAFKRTAFKKHQQQFQTAAPAYTQVVNQLAARQTY